MVPTSKSSAFAINSEIAAIVTTANQSIKKQPCLWLLHGSGGISSNDDLWRDRALTLGYTVIQVDSYTNRGIFKQHWDKLDEYRIAPEVRAHDLVQAMYWLKDRYPVMPFADITNSVCVGFSDGASGAICLQEHHSPDLWRKSFCLYPGLPRYFLDRVTNIRNEKTHIFVGELDNWTPAAACEEFQSNTNCSLTIIPDTHHSFSKPGINQWHEQTLRTRTERGVFCKYSETATQMVMDKVFNA